MEATKVPAGQGYYLDTSVWIDLYEDRLGYLGEPLGDYAWEFVFLIKASGSFLVISEMVYHELEKRYSAEEVRGMMNPFGSQIVVVGITDSLVDEAKSISRGRTVPFGDALHAVISRDNGFILIARDNHFRRLRDICPFLKPEEILGIV
ncbi:MAG: PIN domain-containing protein [Nanoarchaeota archaeon]